MKTTLPVLRKLHKERKQREEDLRKYEELKSKLGFKSSLI